MLTIYLFYQYISILVEETGRPRRLDLPAKIFLVIAELGSFLLSIHYMVTLHGNCSDELYADVCYVRGPFYLLLCAVLLIAFTVCILQLFHHT